MPQKKIIRMEPFSPNVMKVIYEGGGVGFKSIDKGQSNEIEIPDQGREGSPQAWGESMDAEPASPQELNNIEEALRELRFNRVPEVEVADTVNKMLDPKSVVRESEISIMSLPEKKRGQ